MITILAAACTNAGSKINWPLAVAISSIAVSAAAVLAAYFRYVYGKD
jgi:hypothetical protein